MSFYSIQHAKHVIDVLDMVVESGSRCRCLVQAYQPHGLEDGGRVADRLVHLDPLIRRSSIFKVKRMKLISLGKLIQLGVVRGVRPYQGIGSRCTSLLPEDASRLMSFYQRGTTGAATLVTLREYSICNRCSLATRHTGQECFVHGLTSSGLSAYGTDPNCRKKSFLNVGDVT